MDQSTEVFWRTGALRWQAMAERGHNLFTDVGPDHAVVLTAAEPLKDFDDLLVREKEHEFVRMLAIGEPDAVNTSLDRVREQAAEGNLAALPGRGALPAPSRAMLQSNSHDGLADRHCDWLGPHIGNRWDFFYSDSPLPTPKGDEFVARLDLPTWRAEIERVISASNPTTSALRDLDDLTWYGYIDGNLLGGAMGVERLPNADGTNGSHFAGLGTDPELQGNGIGGAVMAGTINRELDEVEIVSFGMWSWNDRARKLYRRLGITEGYSYVTHSREPLPEQ